MAEASFDGVANAYDAQFTDTEVGRRQRDQVRAFLSGLLPHWSNPQVLELNCGTGADACWLAEQGAQVVATDLSAEMVRVGAGRPGSSAVTWQAGDLREMVQQSPATYDLIFSNFGGLNCIDADDFRQFGRDTFASLRPGGVFVGVVMARFCLWEALYFLAKGRPGSAFRRLSSSPLEVPLGDGHFQSTWYYAPKQMETLMGTGWRRVALQPVGFFLPPSYLAPFFDPKTRLLSTLADLESSSRNHRFRAAWADHFLLALQKES